MNIKQLAFLSLLSISASAFSGQEDSPLIPPGFAAAPPSYQQPSTSNAAPSAPTYQELPQQNDYDDGSEKNDTKLADEAVETKAEKPEKKKEKQTVSCSTGKKARVVGLVSLLLLSISGLAPDSVTINHSLAPFESTAVAYSPKWRFTPDQCATDLVKCTSDDDERFEQMCGRFNARNATRGGFTKRRGGPPPRYQLSRKPKSCTKTCNMVKNKIKCTEIAMKEGRVVYKECTALDGNDTEGAPVVIDKTTLGTGIASLLTRLGTIAITGIILAGESSICG